MDEIKLTSAKIVEEIKQHWGALEKFGIKKIGIFGSFARGEQQENSDIDFLVEFKEPDFDNFMGLISFLEDLFGRKVEILTPAGVDSIRIGYIKDEIKRSVMYA